MRRYLGLTVLILLLASCWRIPTDVSFTTDPRVLRGTWTGVTESVCAQNLTVPINSSLNSTGTQFFAISGTALEVFNASNGAKLGGFNLSSATFPVIWSDDGTQIIYLRTTLTSSIERAVVNPLTGADISAATLATDFSGSNFNYNNDLTRVAVFSTSNFSGLSKVDLFDVVTGVLVKSKSISKTNPELITLNAAGTQMAYTVTDTDKIQVWVYDFNADTNIKVFERSSATFFITAKPVFSSNNQLNFRYSENITTTAKIGIKRINLTDLTNQDTPIPNTTNFTSAIQITADGIRFAYVQDDVLYVKNLETNAVITQKSLATIDYSANRLNFSSVLSSNANGTAWLVTGTRIGCSVRAFETTTQTLTPNAALALDDSQNISMTFVPTYRDSSSYTFTGTFKMGIAPERNIRGSVMVKSECSSIYNNCEKLTPSTPSLPPPPYPLTDVHFVSLQYENGTAFEYPLTVVGYQNQYQYYSSNQTKTQFYAGTNSYYSNNPQDKKFLLNPPVTP